MRAVRRLDRWPARTPRGHRTDGDPVITSNRIAGLSSGGGDHDERPQPVGPSTASPHPASGGGCRAGPRRSAARGRRRAEPSARSSRPDRSAASDPHRLDRSRERGLTSSSTSARRRREVVRSDDARTPARWRPCRPQESSGSRPAHRTALSGSTPRDHGSSRTDPAGVTVAPLRARRDRHCPDATVAAVTMAASAPPIPLAAPLTTACTSGRRVSRRPTCCPYRARWIIWRQPASTTPVSTNPSRR